jgi:2-polyprenyl-6-hydroxyphenyl methylase/3-demethylubiquinone-9 3-methyltransferase
MPDTTIDPGEIGKFERMAAEWWDEAGKFRPLHKFNPVRLAYIRDNLVFHFGRDGHARRPLEGLRILDVGCGGGLLSEPLARLGATVTGIDAGGENIGIARAHADQSGLEIDYRVTTAEALTTAGAAYDAVLAMEIIEHVDNVPLFMQACAGLVAPGGLLFVASINRTPRAWALAVFAAERVLRWLPAGTHDYRKFLTPEEVAVLAERNGLRTLEKVGVVFHPLAGEWRQSRDTGVNYMVLAQKPRPA